MIKKTLAKSKALTFCMLVATSVTMSLPLVATEPAHAATTFIVTSTGDEADVNLNDSFCDVNPSLTGFRCTLRAAIQEANDTAGADTINFSIPDDPSVPGNEVKTIAPTGTSAELPSITETVTIDGYTQPGASPNALAQGGTDAKLMIELDGSGAPLGASGLTIGASNSVVRGLVIHSFKGTGIVIDGQGAESAVTGVRIEGNFIGTDP